VPRPTRGPRRALARTGLSPALARLSRRFRFAKAWATGLVRVRSSLLTESHLDVLSSGYLDISVRRVRLLPLWIHDKIPPKGWVAPFGDLGITGRSPLPRAFRSVPRPSSPLGAKASTRCPSRARPRPAPRPRCARPDVRCRRSDVRRQRADPACMLLHHPRPLSEALRRIAPTGATRPGVSAYPCPGTTDRPPKPRSPNPKGWTQARSVSPVMPASRSRLASRCQNVHGHTARSGGAPISSLSGWLQKDLRPPATTHACWWAWADLNGRPHAYQACALTS
jgi:hypothetical protein